MSGKLFCGRCGKKIVGSYVTAMGKNFHPECFTCYGCGKSFGKSGYYEKNGRPYCEDCYAEKFGPKCVKCGKAIKGSYITTDKGAWHKKCFVCAGCGTSLAGKSHYEKNGNVYCQACYEGLFLTKCDICNKPIKGRYLTDSWGNSYCASHRNDLPECFFCSRLICEPLTGGGVRYDDGRTVCNICKKTAVLSVADGKSIFREVAKTLGKDGIKALSDPVDIRLVDLKNLGASSHTSRKTMGNTRKTMYTAFGRGKKCKPDEIRFLYGLPKTLFGTVAAHEYGHAWLCVNGYHDLPLVVEEGLCEMFSYLWLRRRIGGWFSSADKPELEYWLKLLENNDDPVYGRGFKMAQKSARRMSLSKLMEYVMKHRAFPYS